MSPPLIHPHGDRPGPSPSFTPAVRNLAFTIYRPSTLLFKLPLLRTCAEVQEFVPLPRGEQREQLEPSVNT